MKFCPNCGSAVEQKIPKNDTLPRYVCTSCEMIHYQNPRVVVCCIAEWQQKILLCRRAIQPRYGLWTVPGGFLENKETTSQAAVRETWEEANAKIELGPVFALLNVPHISQVHVFYRAQLQSATYSSGNESLDVALFDEEKIPWDNMAFRTTAIALKYYFVDRRNNNFGFHSEDIPAR